MGNNTFLRVIFRVRGINLLMGSDATFTWGTWVLVETLS